MVMLADLLVSCKMLGPKQLSAVVLSDVHKIISAIRRIDRTHEAGKFMGQKHINGQNIL